MDHWRRSISSWHLSESAITTPSNTIGGNNYYMNIGLKIKNKNCFNLLGSGDIAHDIVGRRIDPSRWIHWTISRFNITGVAKGRGMCVLSSMTVQIKEGKEGNVLFNNALNTFYLRLYGVRHMVKDNSDSERENPLPPYGLLLPISSKGSFYIHDPTDRITHTTTFVTPVVEHWLEREIAQWVHHEGSIPWPIAPWVNALTTELHLLSQIKDPLPLIIGKSSHEVAQWVSSCYLCDLQTMSEVI